MVDNVNPIFLYLVIGTCTLTAKQLPAPITRVTCPPGCTEGDLWGTVIYTKDSSVCTAATHTGIVTAGSGGDVIVQQKPGLESYIPSTRNGVASKSQGPQSGSFVLSQVYEYLSLRQKDDLEKGKSLDAPIPSVIGTCTLTAKQLPAPITRVTCPPGCTKGDLWGTVIYTKDSSVCTAATHTGIVTAGSGGDVIVQQKTGQESYIPSTRNGVASKSQGPQSGSFVLSQVYEYLSLRQKDDLEKGKSLDAPTPSVKEQCSYTAKQLPAKYTVVICPPGCLTQKDNVWGCDTYTEESSVCAAAIHCGEITNKGGKVVAQKTLGQYKYGSCTRNGIKTKHSGPSFGSFVFISLAKLQSTLSTQTHEQPPQTDVQRDLNEGSGMNWDASTSTEMKLDTKSGTTFNSQVDYRYLLKA
ncbi:cysteine-rich secretory protein LCCL domain-containing 1-like [Bufo gargarizans]|uniref:cysteine-rich secretory protein LCCL domain-containing 1-like n=1 Tax=Bufo gargarizans TaxID=30331 RepID=UPI001CF38163|nr:cysteine-rich secretory protein LCCL domain-containing 1-like [Bufo gargarizans]